MNRLLWRLLLSYFLPGVDDGEPSDEPPEPEGDEVTGRRLLMWNNDVEISLCRPQQRIHYFFRNGERDEVIFVHEGSGTLETIFGDVPYREGDYVVVPRGTTYRFAPHGPQRHLVFTAPAATRQAGITRAAGTQNLILTAPTATATSASSATIVRLILNTR